MIYINPQMPHGGSGSTSDPMLQILQMLTSDREAERAEWQANHATVNPNTAPRTGSNAVPVAAKDKSQVTCYDCGNKGHYSNEWPNKKNATAPNTNVPAQQQRRVQPGRRFAPGNSLNRN